MKNLLYILLIFVLTVCCKQNIEKQVSPIPTQQVSYVFKHEVRSPSVKSDNPPALILLHGLGSNEQDLFSFAQHLDPRLLVIAARAPISLGSDSFSWYNLNSSPDGWSYDIGGVKQSSNDLLTYIDQIINNYHVDPDKIFIGGFSQGAIMSLTVGLNNSVKIAGVIALSGRLYPELKSELSKIKDFHKLKLFISHGKQDQVLPFQDMVADVAYIESLGIDPVVNYYDAAHTISQDNFKDMINWLSSQLD